MLPGCSWMDGCSANFSPLGVTQWCVLRFHSIDLADKCSMSSARKTEKAKSGLLIPKPLEQLLCLLAETTWRTGLVDLPWTITVDWDCVPYILINCMLPQYNLSLNVSKLQFLQWLRTLTFLQICDQNNFKNFNPSVEPLSCSDQIECRSYFHLLPNKNSIQPSYLNSSHLGDTNSFLLLWFRLVCDHNEIWVHETRSASTVIGGSNERVPTVA